MIALLNTNSLKSVLLLLFLLVPFHALEAHIVIQTPNGGEVFDAGSEVTIEWEITVRHITENWDIWYSTTGKDGPWIEIAMDLPVGDPSSGSLHSYQWIVPDVSSDQMRIRVQQDNLNFDYDDKSNADFTVVPVKVSGDPIPVAAGDTLMLEAQGSTFPNELTALVLEEANDIPMQMFIAYLFLDGTGKWVLPAVVPPGLAGETITLGIYARNAKGKLVAGNPLELQFQ